MARRIGIGALAGRRTVTVAEFVGVVVVARAELPAGAQRTGEFEIDAVADDVRIAELETAVRIVVVAADEVRIVALTDVIQRKRCVEPSVAGTELDAGLVVLAGDRCKRSVIRGDGFVIDRKSVVSGKSVSVSVDLGGRRIIKKKKNKTQE